MARYMEVCLSDPKYGYYRRREPIGAAGDFITAPEVSQMFGELIGLWCAVTWYQMGAPERIHLVELGPGRGTLMQDALRAVRGEPEFCSAFSLHLVETGDRLRNAQCQRLAGAQAAWHLSLESVPPGPLLLIANEFFDALPVHQYEMTADGWRERLVTFHDGACRLQLAPLPCALNRPGQPGDVFEQAPARNTYMADIAARLQRHGGAALIIDYGHSEGVNGDTLQAVRTHRAQSIFAEPGLADLTSHVDFEALGRAAPGLSRHGPRRQGEFLRALGIEARAAMLQRSASPDQAKEIDTALHRLLGSRQMGDLFKVLAVTQQDAPVPAGFERYAAAAKAL